MLILDLGSNFQGIMGIDILHNRVAQASGRVSLKLAGKLLYSQQSDFVCTYAGCAGVFMLWSVYLLLIRFAIDTGEIGHWNV